MPNPSLAQAPSSPLEALHVGDLITTLHARRPGTVVKVYRDGSACIKWDDKPAPLGLGHERVPREFLTVTATSTTESEGGEA